jgi:hypothetical protein
MVDEPLLPASRSVLTALPDALADVGLPRSAARVARGSRIEYPAHCDRLLGARGAATLLYAVCDAAPAHSMASTAAQTRLFVSLAGAVHELARRVAAHAASTVAVGHAVAGVSVQLRPGLDAYECASRPIDDSVRVRDGALLCTRFVVTVEQLAAAAAARPTPSRVPG